MSKQGPSYIHPMERERPWDIHPIWRGIGCLLLILLPIISFAAARLLVQANFEQKWVAVPRLLRESIRVPMLARTYYAELAVTVILIILGFGLLTVMYSLIYRLFGPSKYGPLDAPPE